MDWKQENHTLVASSEFGQYKISREIDMENFSLILTGKEDDIPLGSHFETIGAATEAAESDMAYRSNMWETL